MFMSKWQTLLLRPKGKKMSTEKVRDLPQATQQPQVPGLLIQESSIPAAQQQDALSTAGHQPLTSDLAM